MLHGLANVRRLAVWLWVLVGGASLGCSTSSGREDDAGTARSALCSPQDAACNNLGTPEWPRWTDQPNRTAAVFQDVKSTADAGSGGTVGSGSAGSGGASGEQDKQPIRLELVACNPELLGKMPVNPNPKGADLQNISTNFHVLQSLQLLSSIINKGAVATDEIRTKDIKDADKGTCVCEPNWDAINQATGQAFNGLITAHFSRLKQFPQVYEKLTKEKVTEAECKSLCEAPDNDYSDAMMSFIANDIHQSKTGKAKWALQFAQWLDRQAKRVGDSSLAEALRNFGASLDNVDELLQKLQCYVDMFSEGYHLGAYSEQRPLLHFCVPWLGHGAYAALGDSSGRWGIGGRYTEHNLSDAFRAQMRTGGFGITLLGETLSLAPSAEFNMQIDGYKWFNREAPFGMEELGKGNTGGVSIDELGKLQAFRLASREQLASLDSDHDGRVSPQEFVIATFMPFTYRPQGSPNDASWPRDGAKEVEPWEGQSEAVMAAALNFELRIKPISKNLAAIPIGPGFLYPYFKLQAGVKWWDESYRLRQKLSDAINKSLAIPIDATTFDRNSHPFQAPDVTNEAGNTISIKPELGAKFGLERKLGKFGKLEITAGLVYALDVRPGGSGGVVDLNEKLVDALVRSNPPENAECKAQFSHSKQTYCSNRFLEQSILDLSCPPEDWGLKFSTCEQYGTCCPTTVATLYGEPKVAGLQDGVGTAARFLRPTDLVIDRAANVMYVTDRTTIRRIDLASRNVSVLAGSAVAGFANGFGSAASFRDVNGITLYEGALYVADGGNRAVRRVDVASGEVMTVVFSNGLQRPTDVAVARDKLYVLDAGARKLFSVPLGGGAVTLEAGSGAAGSVDGVGSSVSFSDPRSLLSDGFDHLYIADTQAHGLRQVDLGAMSVTTVGSDLIAPVSLALEADGKVLVGSGLGAPGQVRRLDPGTNTTSLVFGAEGTTWRDGGLDRAVLESPYGLAVDASGDMYVADALVQTVRKVSADCASSNAAWLQVDVAEADCKGDFKRYQCFTETKSDHTGWTGPGCHPLQTGFPSACSCQNDLDCAAGETCDLAKRACTVGGTPVSCVCEGASCPGGRSCAAGACVRPCQYNPNNPGASCADNQVCGSSGLCQTASGVPFAEEILAGLKAPEPNHAIATYGLTDIELVSSLNAAIKIGLEFTVFKRTKKWTLLDWRRAWDIGSTGKAKFQPGLEASYQWDSSPYGTVVNHQPSQVTRYEVGPSNDQTAELINQCKSTVQGSATDPLIPPENMIESSTQTVVDFGFKVGEAFANQEKVCIGGKPMLDWLADDAAVDATFVNGSCRYIGEVSADRGNLDFACRETPRALLKHWGCLDTDRSAAAQILAAGAFRGAVSNDPKPTFDWHALLRDPDEDLVLSNLKYRGFPAEQWLAEVEACLDAHQDVPNPCRCTSNQDCRSAPGLSCDGSVCRDEQGTQASCPYVATVSEEPTRCCGDGVQIPGEECDDGNSVNGDGCSSTCQNEGVSACCGATACRDLPDASATSQSDCRAGGGYLVPGKSCSEINSCGIEPEGHCVESDGTCHAPVLQSQCAAAGGIFTAGISCPSTTSTTTVVIQPGPEGKDVWLRGSADGQGALDPDLPYLTAGYWTSGGAPYLNRSVFAFDLPTVPAGSRLVSATLDLFADPESRIYGQTKYNSLPPGHSTHGGSNAFLLENVDWTWSEADMSWNDQPSPLGLQVSLPASTSPTQDYLNIDVRAIVEEALGSGWDQVAFLLRLQDEGGARYREVTFTSSDSAVAERRPRLKLSFSE